MIEKKSFPGWEFRVERPNSLVTSFVLRRTEKFSGISFFHFWPLFILTGVILSFSVFWGVITIGIGYLYRSITHPIVVEERAEVFSGVSLQLSVLLADGSTRHRLIPVSEISDVVLNESAAGYFIQTFLAVIPKRGSPNRVLLPFEYTTLPLWLSVKVLCLLREALHLPCHNT